MGDEVIEPSGDLVEEGQTLPETPEGEPQGGTVEYITKADFDSAIERLSREMQSRSDRSESRVKKAVEDKLAAIDARAKEFRDAGYPVSDEEIKLSKSEVMRKALNQDTEAGPQPYVADPVIEQTNLQAAKLYAEYGAVLTPADQEFSTVNWNAATPDAFLASLTTALKSKNRRLGKAAPQAAQPAPTTPDNSAPSTAKIPTLGAVPGGDRLMQLTNELTALQAADDRYSSVNEAKRTAIIEEMKKLEGR